MKRISYIVATRNKLPYLRVLLDRFSEQLAEDEELIVVDGDSSDGTIDYVAELTGGNASIRFIPGPDHCQAHGYNKGILSAEGRYLKLLTDDDVYYLPVLRRCADFLDEHPEVDVLCANTIDVREREGEVVYDSRPTENSFHEWSSGGAAFWFGDQGLLIRRSSLPIVGLLDTGVCCIDVEFSVRLTTLRQVRLAWYSGVGACSVINAASLSVSDRFAEANAEEVARIFRYYGQIARLREAMKNPDRQAAETVERQINLDHGPLRRFLRPRTRLLGLSKFVKRFGARGSEKVTAETVPVIQPVEHSRDAGKARSLEDWMERYNREHGGKFFLGNGEN